MEGLTVQARRGQVWRTAGLIAAIGALGCGFLILPDVLIWRRAPDPLDLIMVPGLAAGTGRVTCLRPVFSAGARPGQRPIRCYRNATARLPRDGGRKRQNKAQR